MTCCQIVMEMILKDKKTRESELLPPIGENWNVDFAVPVKCLGAIGDGKFESCKIISLSLTSEKHYTHLCRCDYLRARRFSCYMVASVRWAR